MSKERIGIITGGGDAPGLNAVIEGLVRGLHKNFEIVGINDGFEGVFKKQHKILTLQDVYAVHSQAGTLLGTSNKSQIEGRVKEFLNNIKAMNLKGLIAIGGDGTFAALKMVSEIPLIGIPKTIDNDLSGTELTFGFDTACGVVADNADALRFTADAHKRVFVVETMGRTAGWIALGGGLASIADAILIPEREYTRETLADFIKEKRSSERRGLVIVVAEGAKFLGEEITVIKKQPKTAHKVRYGGFAQVVSDWIEQELDWESRFVILGHLQRSHQPSNTDRLLSLTMAKEACRLVSEGKWGRAVVYRSGQVQEAPIADVMRAPRLVPKDHQWIATAQKLGIFI